MNNLIYFSIIIPTLNEEKLLPRLLNCLKNQKDKNFEVIITDGASSDRTKEKTLAYKNDFPMRFFVNGKKNVAFQRNLGARVAKGNYLIFLDADTGVGISFTHSLMKYILRKKGLVFIPYSLPDQNDSQSKLIFKIANFLIEFSQTMGKPISAGGNMIWEKHFFESVGGFNEKLYLAEDHNIIQKAYEWGVRAKFLRNVKVRFSLRRVRREGQLAIFYKYLLSTAHVLIKGDIKKKIYEYEMGGEVNKATKESLTFKQNFSYYLKQLKQFFKQYIS